MAEETIKISAEFEDKLSAAVKTAEQNATQSFKNVGKAIDGTSSAAKSADAAISGAAATAAKAGNSARYSTVDWAKLDAELNRLDRDADKVVRQLNRAGDAASNAGAKAKRTGLGGFIDRQIDPSALGKAGTAALGLGSGLIAVTAANKAIDALRETIERTSDAYLEWERSQASLGRQTAGVAPIMDEIAESINNNNIGIGTQTVKVKLLGEQWKQFWSDWMVAFVAYKTGGGAEMLEAMSQAAAAPANAFRANLTARSTLGGPLAVARTTTGPSSLVLPQSATSIAREKKDEEQATRDAIKALKDFNDRLNSSIGGGFKGKTDLDAWLMMNDPEKAARDEQSQRVRDRINNAFGGIPTAPATDYRRREADPADMALKDAQEKAKEWAATFSSAISDGLFTSQSFADAWSRAFINIIQRAFEKTLGGALESGFTSLLTSAAGGGGRRALGGGTGGNTYNITVEGGNTSTVQTTGGNDAALVIQAVRTAIESQPTYVQIGRGVNYESARGRI